MEGTVVQVYWNIHKKIFSIRDKKTRKVIGYSSEVKLNAATFKVSESGRKRVLKEKKKNVHAYVEGVYVGSDIKDCNVYCEAYYNPYITEFFIDHCSKEKLDGMYTVCLTDKKVFYDS